MTDLVDRSKLFTGARHSVFQGRFNQSQVDGINHILDAWDASPHTDLRWLAYMLATAYHETAATMQPIREYGSDAYLTQMYDVQGRRPDTARSMGNVNPGDGIKYCGRGYVQLTWHTNYKKMGDALGVDLVNTPDLAMDPNIAAKIMFLGMTERKNCFTGKVLSDYLSDLTEDFYNARRIINGLDHAHEIAETAQKFYEVLGLQAAEPEIVKDEIVEPKIIEPKPKKPPRNVERAIAPYRKSVRRLQTVLTETGWYSGPINGVWDAGSETALQAYQQHYYSK